MKLETKNQIEKLFNENVKIKDISKQVNVSLATVNRTLKALGLSKPRHKQAEALHSTETEQKTTLTKQKPKTKIVKDNKEFSLFNYIYLLETESKARRQAIETKKEKIIKEVKEFLFLLEKL